MGSSRSGSSPQNGPSLRIRALLAVGLTAGFYVLALAVAGVLIVVPVSLWAGGTAFNIWAGFAMIAAGATILRAIVPERTPTESPGAPLSRESQPALYRLLTEVAAAVAEPLPAEVYADVDMNASVLELSNGLGRGRRRVMVLGIPLLAVLRPAELRAVIAHEFGHYVGGDTRFGAWIWRTRVAVMRTVTALDKQDSFFQRVIVRGPFLLYAKLFLRLTNAVSRRQEFAADALSARVAGVDAAAAALKRTTGCGAAFAAYWSQDFAYALEHRRRPPLADGFQRFVAAQGVRAGLDEFVGTEIAEAETDPYDSHPTLAERLSALGAQVTADDALPKPAETALALVESVDALERAALLAAFDEDAVTQLKPIAWDEVGELRARDAKELAREVGSVYADARVGSVAELAVDPTHVRDSLRRSVGAEGASDAEVDGYHRFVLSALVNGALANQGWRLEAIPGEPITARRDGVEFKPGAELEAVLEGESTPAAWQERVAALGVADVPLVPGRDGSRPEREPAR